MAQEKKNRNNLAELNDILFAELDRLNDNEVRGEELKEEIDRAKGMINVARTIISNADLVLKARVAESNGDVYKELPGMLS